MKKEIHFEADNLYIAEQDGMCEILVAYQKKTGIVYKQINYDPNNGFSFLHNDKWGYMNHKFEIFNC